MEVCPPDATIVIESTISPGTIDSFIRPLVDARRKQAHINVHLAHAPERIIPGNMIYELEHNNRTIGADDPKIAEKIRTLYASFCQGEIVLTDIRTAEMSKVVENTFRDINIAFANELAKICRIGGLDVHEIIRIANMHPRVNILNPGPGVGGHCISVDPWFLVGDYPQTAQLIKQARLVNSSMPRYVLTRARAIMDERGIDSVHKVGIYGLTYKADVDDVRESPTLQMLDAMRSCLCTESLRVYDPWVKDDIVAGQVHSVEELLKGTELLIVMVGHSQLQELLPSFSGISILDTCNVCENASGCDIYRL